MVRFRTGVAAAPPEVRISLREILPVREAGLPPGRHFFGVALRATGACGASLKKLPYLSLYRKVARSARLCAPLRSAYGLWEINFVNF